MGWVATEAFTVVTEIFQPYVVTNSVSRQGLGLGHAWVTTRVSLCREIVFPRVGHSCHDRRFYVTIDFSQGWDILFAIEDFMLRQGFPRVVLRQSVFLSRPIRQACERDRVMGACTTGLGISLSAHTSGSAARAVELQCAQHAQLCAFDCMHGKHDRDPVVTGTSLS